MTNLRTSIVQGLAWSTVEQWGREAITFAVFILLSRLLGPEAFGLLALATLFILVGNHLADFGFRSAIVQRETLDDTVLATAFWSNLGLGLVLCGTTFALAGPIAALLGEPVLAPILRILSLQFLASGASTVHEAVLLRRMAFRPLAVRANAAAFAGGAAGVTMAFLGYGVWSLVAQHVLTFSVGAATLWWASGWRPRLAFSLPEARSLFRFGLPILGFNLMGQLNGRFNQFLIGAFLGAVALGYYVIAFRIVSVLLQLLTAVGSRVALPAFSRMQHDRARLRAAFTTAAGVTSLVAFPAFVGLMVVAPVLVAALIGPVWAPSAPLLSILAAVGLLQSVTYFNGAVLVAVGKPQVRLAQLSLHTAVNVGLFFVAVPYGLVAVAAAFVARAYLLLPFDLWLLRRYASIAPGPLLAAVARPLAASLTMAALVLGVGVALDALAAPGASTLLWASVGAGLVGYGVLSAVLMPRYRGTAVTFARHAVARVRTGGAQ